MPEYYYEDLMGGDAPQSAAALAESPLDRALRVLKGMGGAPAAAVGNALARPPREY